MAGAQQFLGALATVLCVAAATTVLFQALRQPRGIKGGAGMIVRIAGAAGQRTAA